MIGFLLILGACLLWAVDTLIRYPLINSGMNAALVVFYEHLLLTIVLFVISYRSLEQFRKMRLNNLFSFVMIGGVGSALATVSFTQAFQYLNPSLVIILQKFQPVVVILLASIVLKEKIKLEFLLWASVCLFGALLISYEDILKLIESKDDMYRVFFHPGAPQGYILTMFSVLGWGAATVYGKKLSLEGFSDDIILLGRFSLGLIFLTPIVFVSQADVLFTQNIEIYSKISLMVFVSGLLAMFLYYQGLRRISARMCSLGEMFFPFMGVVINWLFLDAVLTPIQVIGGLILVGASITIQIKQY